MSKAKRVTITDIARLAGVSPGAVSFALNGRPGVSEQTRQRILDIAEEHQWLPSSAARALVGSRAGVIGTANGRATATRQCCAREGILRQAMQTFCQVMLTQSMNRDIWSCKHDTETTQHDT